MPSTQHWHGGPGIFPETHKQPGCTIRREIIRRPPRSAALTRTGRNSMQGLAIIVDWHAQLARVLDHLRSILLLLTRVWVSWQFLKSGWLKATNWDVTLELFRYEYHVPLLSPQVAAMAGTFGQLFFPVLLICGLFTRAGALGLFAVNAFAL